MSEITMDKEFKPTLNDKNFKIWESNGLTKYNHIVSDKGIDTSDNLLKYNLPKSHFYKYL